MYLALTLGLWRKAIYVAAGVRSGSARRPSREHSRSHKYFAPECHGRRRVPYTRPKFPKDDLTSSMGTRSMVGKGCSSSLRRQCRRCRMQDSHAFEPHFPWFPQLLHGYTTKKKSFGGIGSISLLCNSVLTKALALIVTSPAPTAAQSGTLRVFVCRSAPLAGHRRDFPILKIGLRGRLFPQSDVVMHEQQRLPRPRVVPGWLCHESVRERSKPSPRLRASRAARGFGWRWTMSPQQQEYP